MPNGSNGKVKRITGHAYKSLFTAAINHVGDVGRTWEKLLSHKPETKVYKWGGCCANRETVTTSNYLSRKTIPTFVSRLVHSLFRLCDNEDFYDPLPGWLPIYSISENKTKLKKWSIWNVQNFGFRVLPGRLCADNEDFYKLLAQINTFQPLGQLWKEKEIRNYDWV